MIEDAEPGTISLIRGAERDDGRSALDHHSSSDYKLLAALALLVFAFTTCFAGLHQGPGLGDHESINALGARQSLQSGEWLIPKVGEVPWVRKAPLGIWLIGAFSYLTGSTQGGLPVSDFSSRLPSAVAAFLNVLAVGLLARRMFGDRTGLVAGFIAAACAATVYFARNAQVDMVLALFNTLAFACFWRGAVERPGSRWAMAGFYVAFGLAMLAKFPLPLATVGLTLAVYWFITVPLQTAVEPAESGAAGSASRFFRAFGQQFTRRRALWLAPGIVLFLVIAGSWPAYVYSQVDNAWALWRIEYLDRFTGEMAEQGRPFWYYLPLIFVLSFPFMLSMPEAVAAPFLPRYREQRRGLWFAFTWALVGTAFISVSSFKRPHYLISMMPAYCLLLAPVIDRLFFGAFPSRPRLVRVACAVLAVLLVAGAAVGGFAIAPIAMVYPGLLATYAVYMVAVVILWSLACLAYAHARRFTSFALLNLGVPVMVLMIWPALGEKVKLNPEAEALIAAFREHGVTASDAIYEVDDRPDSSIEFHSGYRIQRLINEVEMAGLQGNRRGFSAELTAEADRRIRERLKSPGRVYFIMAAGRHEAFFGRSDIGMEVLFRVSGFRKDPADDTVVLTRRAS